MAPTQIQSPTPSTHEHAERGGPIDAADVDELDLELALKSVSCNPRDLAQFLRSCRAQ